MKNKPDHGLSMEPMPHSDRVRTLKVDDRIELRYRRWDSTHRNMFLLMGGIWLVLTVVFLLPDENGEWRLSFFSGGMLLTIVWNFYVIVGFFLNHVRIFVEGGKLRVIETPLPLRLPLSLNASAIHFIDVAQTPRTRPSQMKMYDVVLWLDTGEKRWLTGGITRGMTSRDDALFIKQELEFILGLDGNEPRKEKTA